MRYLFDSDLHIHSKLSLCSNDPEQTAERIIQYAKDNSLNTVCVTDHYWDSTIYTSLDFYQQQDFEHISKIKPLPQSENIKFLFGCETEMFKDMQIGIPPERYNDFDFIIIALNHFHMEGYSISKECSTPEARADFLLKNLIVC